MINLAPGLAAQSVIRDVFTIHLASLTRWAPAKRKNRVHQVQADVEAKWNRMLNDRTYAVALRGAGQALSGAGGGS